MTSLSVKETTNELVKEIVSLALKLQSSGIAHVFVQYYAHVNELCVYIHANGWKANDDPDCKYTCYLESNDSDKKLEEIITHLLKIYENEPRN